MTVRKSASSGIHVKIERSSLGTKSARQARARVTEATAKVVVSRAAAYPREMGRASPGG